ncbi:MAG: hypothetical protein WBP41_02025 [Saprospiraceae bacterium]
MKLEQLKLRDLSSKLPDRIDVFLCCSSFEERSLVISNTIISKQILLSFIFFNPKYSERIIENKTELLSIFRNSKVIEIAFDIKNPIAYISSFNNVIKQIKTVGSSPLNIVVDITTFTHETLLILINVLRNHFNFKENNIYFTYNIAADYSYDTSDIKDKWLSRGIGDIRSVVTYPGLINPTLPYHLIILVGFEAERTSLLIENFDTTMVSLGIGYTEIARENIEEMGKISEQNHKEIANRFPNVFSFKFSLDNPLKTSEEILNHISKFPGTNSIIAPMSNKISTVGVALAYFKSPSIQICYASANQYNVNNYSIPGVDCILFQLEI